MNAIAFPDRLLHPSTQVWVELRFAARPLGLGEIVLAVRRQVTVRVGTVHRTLRRWVQAGLVEIIGKPEAYQMTAQARRLPDPPLPDYGTETVRDGWTEHRGPRQRLWTAMRVLKRFDLVTLRMSADVTEPRAKEFLRNMVRAGYLREMPPTSPMASAGWAIGPRQCGPLSPIVRYRMVDGRPFLRVVDRNDGTVIDVPIRPKALRDRLFLPPQHGGEG